MRHASLQFVGLILASLLLSACAQTPQFIARSTITAQTLVLDASNGTGFVGAGVVRRAFDWNSSELQARARHVTFTYTTAATYDVECLSGPVQRSGFVIVRDIVVLSYTTVRATIVSGLASRPPIDGFTLAGFGETVFAGNVPELGAPCPGSNGMIVALTQTVTESGLHVSHAGVVVPLQ